MVEVIAMMKRAPGVTPTGVVDAEVIAGFRDLGVDRIVPLALGSSTEQLLDFVETAAAAA